MQEKQTSTYRTINRFSDILNAFEETENALTLSEISRKIHLPKSTTFRFLEAMTAAGLLTFREDQHGYVPGSQLIRWGRIAQERLDLRNLALPLMRKLTESTGEMTVLSIRDGNWGMWIDQIESKHPIRLANRSGNRLMLHAGASSKVLLAFLPEDQMMKIVNDIDLIPLSTNTITNKNELIKELEQIRLQGYATSIEETDTGAMGIAAPVYDFTLNVVAGLGIAAPLSRISIDQFSDYAEQVMNTCDELSVLLGAAKGKSIVSQTRPN